MVEKRIHPSDGYADTDSKRVKTNGTSAAGSDAKARAQAKLNELAAKRKASSQDSPSSNTPNQQQQASKSGSTNTNVTDLKARLAAISGKAPQVTAPKKVGLEDLKARLAAASNKSQHVSTSRDDASPPQRPPAEQAVPPRRPLPSDNRNEDPSLEGGRGGLNTKLHPLLLQGFGKGDTQLGSDHATVKGNQRAAAETSALQSQANNEQLREDNPYLDPGHSSKNSAPHERRARPLAFNVKGKYIAQGEALRKQAELEEFKARLAAEQRKKALQEDRSEHAFVVKDVPAIEWWDEALIDGESYPDFDKEPTLAEAKMKLEGEDTVITDLVQHPILLDPPMESLHHAPTPMYLTKKEMAKLRRQKRNIDHKEKTAKIRLGLQEPDPPKVKKSNLMRVLGEQAVKDPTAVEARVTREIEERREVHNTANQERALTKEKRLEKIKDKAQTDAAKGLIQSVYRIDSLAYGKSRSKILMNAKQHHDLTGVLVTNPNCCCVVFEGGQHTTKELKKLMERRIAWTENAPSTAMVKDHEGNEKPQPPPWLRPEDENGKLKDLSGNQCVLVWEGEIKQRSFKHWSQKDYETDAEARQLFEKNKLENLWMAARNPAGGEI